MFVGCKLPAGLIVHHEGIEITLNGSNVGYDPDAPWKNDLPPDSLNRISGVGITELKGAEADAFKAWCEISGKGPGPVANDLIFIVDTKADARSEAKRREGKKSSGALDPDKDLPKELSTDTDKKE